MPTSRLEGSVLFRCPGFVGILQAGPRPRGGTSEPDAEEGAEDLGGGGVVHFREAGGAAADDAAVERAHGPEHAVGRPRVEAVARVAVAEAQVQLDAVAERVA